MKAYRHGFLLAALLLLAVPGAFATELPLADHGREAVLSCISADFATLKSRDESVSAAVSRPVAIPLHRHGPLDRPVVGETPGQPAFSPEGSRSLAPATISAPTVNGFQALVDNNTAIPPDTQGAVGPDHVMTTLNSQVRIQDKSGTVLSTVSLDAFFSPLKNANNAQFSTFDPHVRFDPLGSRWVVVAAADGELSTAATLVAVSQSADPTGSWNYTAMLADAGGANWADYPALGMNKDWIVVTVNLFTVSTSNFVKAQIYVLNKADLYAGNQVTVKTFSDTSGGFTLQPAVTHDPSLATLYLLDSWNGNSLGKGYVRLSTISGTVGSEKFTAGTFTPNVSSTWNWGSAGEIMPQLGSTRKIDGGDDRILNCVYRNSSLWCAQTVYLPAVFPTRSAAQWWQLDPASGAILQFGRVDDATGVNFYAFPTIAVNKNDDVLLSYSEFAASHYASAAFSFRYGTDAANTMQSSTIFKAGEAPYYKTYGGTSNRWGDYSSTVVDPADDLTLWTIQEYATTPSGGYDRWATWWAKVVSDSDQPADGVCGSSNGGFFPTVPTSNLCAAGVPSVVSGNGHPWSWTCDGLNGGSSANCSATITSYHINFFAATGGAVSGATSQIIDYGGSATAVTAVPNSGYQFANWTGTGGFSSTGNPLTLSNVSADMNITANFVLDPIVINNAATSTASATVNLALTYGGATGMQFLIDKSSKWTKLEPFVASKTVKLPSGSGIKSVAVRFVDSQENSSAIYRASIFLDTAAPVGSITINSGAASTTSRDLTLTLTATDLGSGVAWMRFSEDGKSWSDSSWVPYATSHSYTLGSVPVLATVTYGSKKVYVQFRDAAGNLSKSAFGTISYVSQAVVATAGSITINGGDRYTTSTGVSLTPAAPSGQPYVRLSNDGSKWSSWLAAVSPLSWNLAKGDGVKTVYAQYSDDKLTPTATFSDTIILDTIVPVGWLLIEDGAAVTSSTGVTLTLGASDVNGIGGICIKETTEACSSFEAYVTSKSYTIQSPGDGVKNIYASFRDNAGKVSKVAKARITLDTLAPSGSVVINGGAATTSSTIVTLKLAASKAVYMQLSTDGGQTWGGWEPYATSRTAQVPAGAGEKTVKVKFMDFGGNASPEYADSIRLL